MAKKAETAPKPKKECPILRDKFKAEAKPVSVVVDGVPFVAMVKEFSTGSFGWYLSGKTQQTVGGVPCDIQLGFNLTVVGSKDAK